MNHPVRYLVCAAMLALSVSAHAGTKLTSAQCHDYPFVHANGPVSHRQLVNELNELESVGYNPSSGDESSYPDDIDSAQARLMQKYQHDCAGAANTVASSGN
ncbi:DUF4148 domain-containing protein [Burkholderia orbicola]|jgi:hypothetical protein|uniref:DUF4148 domain-containing protein n=3 Tax=Burkholderia cepacia complex TaxID=87882 RepID=A0A3N9EPD1_9BURK|nr:MULTISPECIES: DUF4148 domain-containing protein [Burkholderia]EAY64677.1 hypothetical protein BCPG_03013 [Burkholderia cenocepacia PC184]EKS9845562.1 DUF4148 domain-containing protein [Burkholderia cepacia]ESS38460.1 hypothetical protein P355_4945 [Burkholderia cenocepacia KC-01]BEV49681.1 hypothetical protein BconGalA64_21800 [Burkholderia contaminans]ABK11361.1 conserved hypothetical protein [Burkholderia cenocepacia HI2424]